MRGFGGVALGITGASLIVVGVVLWNVFADDPAAVAYRARMLQVIAMGVVALGAGVVVVVRRR